MNLAGDLWMMKLSTSWGHSLVNNSTEQASWEFQVSDFRFQIRKGRQGISFNINLKSETIYDNLPAKTPFSFEADIKRKL